MKLNKFEKYLISFALGFGIIIMGNVPNIMLIESRGEITLWQIIMFVVSFIIALACSSIWFKILNSNT